MRPGLLVTLFLLMPVAAFCQDFAAVPFADLKGWTPLAGEWKVEGDALVGRAPAEMAWIQLDGDYADFELSFEFQTPTPSNGGLQFRSQWLPKLPLPEGVPALDAPRQMYGYQANVETRQRGATGRLVDENGRGPLAEASADASKSIKQKTPNQMRVVAQGNVIEVYLNEVLASRTEDEAFIKGRFAFQVMPNEAGQPVAEVLYRSIKLKDLGRTGNWRALFNGANFDGWQIYGSESWTVEDGIIAGRSGPEKSEGYLATVEQFKNFRVCGAFKMLGDGNFGLFYHSTIKMGVQGDDPEYPFISGLQGEVEPGYPSKTGWVYESYKRGWLVEPDPKTTGALALRPDAWNEIEIRTEGNHITTWVNGVRTLDHVDAAPNLVEGSFALQLHTGGVDGIQWKDLYLKQ